MATSRVYLFEDEIEQSLLEEFTASDQSSFSDESDTSGTDDLTVGEVIGAECSDNESDDVQFATASSVPSASSAWSAIFTWEDMTHYVGKGNSLLITMGLKMKLTVLKCSKCFLMMNWWN
jgi:hypothetical protein